ncbi:MAG: PAS domain-containing protein [Acidobacteria bacterium]|nr:PAS domain-containing protein [Acidobacteriota bacterium]
MPAQCEVPKLYRPFEADVGVVFALDEGLAITYCNPAWDHFASANGGSRELLREFQGGRPLLDSIPGALRECYETNFLNVLKTGVEWWQCYECSSPDTYRLHHMRVIRTEDPYGLLVINSQAASHPHAEALAHEDLEQYVSQAGIVTMCANCRRVRRNECVQWDWFPKLVAAMPEKVSHALCSACWAVYYPKYLAPA